MTNPPTNPPERYRGLFDAAQAHLQADAGRADSHETPLNDFLDRLRKSGLLNEDDWSTVVSESKSAADARELAGQLLNRGRLTAWQCRMLLEGRTSFRIGDYELLSSLGAGGMGVVYKARQVSLNRVVALKMIRAGEFASEEEMHRFQREAEAVAQLDHPGIVPVFEVGAWDGQPFFSMGYVDGRSLKERLADGPLPNREAAELLRSVAEGVAYANARGVIHRDLKPGNILLTAPNSDAPKITDFGLAKQTEAESDVTKTGQALGTPSYMPPEQALGKAELIGPTSDVYSLGAVLYCVLTVRPPFQAATPVETLRQVVLNEPLAPRSFNAAIDRDLETICLKCLHKDPQQRYADAQLLAEDLSRYLAGEPIQARPVGTVERSWRWMKRRPVAAGLLFASVLALAATSAAIVFMVFNRRLSDSFDAETAARRQAVAAKSEAEDARKNESKQRQRAESALDLLKYSVYNNDILTADQAFRDGDRARSLARLNAAATDRRGWEWRYLRNRFDAHLLKFESSTDAVAYSPDRRWIAGRRELTTVLWDARTGRVAMSMRGFLDHVQAIRFNTNGNRLIAAGPNKLAIWDTTDGRLIRATPFGARIFRRIDIDPNRNVVLVGTLGRFTCWHVESGRRVFDRPDPGVAYLHNVDFSPEGRRFVAVVVSRDGKATVEIRSGTTGRLDYRLPSTSSATCAAFSPDGTEIATGTDDGRIEVWDIATRTQKYAFHGMSFPIYRIRFSPDSRMIAASGANSRLREVRLWLNTPGGVVVSAIPIQNSMRPELAFSPDGRRLALAGAIETEVFDATGEVNPLDYGGEGLLVDDTEFFRNSRRIATSFRTITRGKNSSGAGVWDLNSPSQPVMMQGKTGRSLGIAVSSDGRLVATSGDKKDPPKIWDAATGRLVRVINVGHKPVKSVSFSTDGKLLATTSDAGTVVWETTTGRRLHELPGNPKRYEPAQFLPVGNQLLATRVASKAQRSMIHVVDGSNGNELRSFPIDPSIVNDVTILEISPDGKRIAVGDGRRIAIVDAQDGRLIVSIRGAGRDAKRLCFSPDGRRLATSDFHAVRLWDTRTGQELMRIDQQLQSPVRFSPDGRWLAVGLKLYDAAAKSETASAARVAFHRGTALRWHLRTAKSQRTGGNWFTAGFHYEQAARLLTNKPMLRIDSGRMYARHGDASRARRQFKIALRSGQALRPDIRAHYLAEVGRYDEARSLYAGLASNPKCESTTLKGYAMLLLGVGDESGYRRIAHRLLKRTAPATEPEHDYNATWTAVVRLEADVDSAKLLRLARAAYKKDPKEPGPRIALGAAYYRTGDECRAIAILESAEKMTFGKWPETYLFLALANQRIGKKVEAQRCYRRALHQIATPDVRHAAVPTWVRRTIIRCLRREALNAIGPAVAPRP